VAERTSKAPDATEGPEPSDQPIAFDDAALVDACQKGKMQAFEALIAKYQDRVYNTVLRMCGNPDDAADLCQETFVRALEKIRDFRGQSRFYTWLFRIAVNMTISHRRRAGRVKFVSLAPDPELDNTQAAAMTSRIAERREGNPAQAAMDRDSHQRVLEALEALDDEYRVVVVLRDIEEMNYQQMAATLALPIGTVKSRLHRGRCLLREKLADALGPATL